MSAVPVVGSPSSDSLQSGWRYFPFAQAGAAAVALFLNVTTGFDDSGVVTIVGWTMLQVIAYRQWPGHPFRYRVFSALAGLSVFSACFLPAILVGVPMGRGAAAALAVLASLPTLALAFWVLRRSALEPVSGSAPS